MKQLLEDEAKHKKFPCKKGSECPLGSPLRTIGPGHCRLIFFVVFSPYCQPTSQTEVKSIDTLLSQGDTLDLLAVSCDNDFTILQGLAVSMQVTLQDMIEQMAQVLDTLSCETVVPLYTNAVYEASCNTSVSALTWIFVSLLVMGTAGMVMITLRASVRETEYVISNKGPSGEDAERDADVSWSSKLEPTDKADLNETDELFDDQQPEFLDEITTATYGARQICNEGDVDGHLVR